MLVLIRFKTRTLRTNVGWEPERRWQRGREVERRNGHKPQTERTDSHRFSPERAERDRERPKKAILTVATSRTKHRRTLDRLESAPSERRRKSRGFQRQKLNGVICWKWCDIFRRLEGRFGVHRCVLLAKMAVMGWRLNADWIECDSDGIGFSGPRAMLRTRRPRRENIDGAGQSTLWTLVGLRVPVFGYA